MRTITVRLSRAEHRLLSDLAAAEEIDLEALVREALALGPLDPDEAKPCLQLVEGTGAPRPGPAP